MAFDPEAYALRREMYGSSKKTSGSGPASFFVSMLDAANDKTAADSKLKTEILKAHLRSQDALENSKARMDYKADVTANDPVQLMLRRRLQASNPLAEMDIPTADRQDESVSFPASKIDQAGNGKLAEKPISSEQQKMMFITKYNQMMDAAKNGTGPAPAPAMQAVYQKYFNDVNKVKSNSGLTMDDMSDTKSAGQPSQPVQNSGKSVFQQAMDAITGKGGQPSAQQPPVQAPPAQAAPAAQAPKYNVGDPVQYQGKSYKVSGIRDDGSLELA